jgi:oxygen-independent coproporphyrinogen-3 oxidase
MESMALYIHIPFCHTKCPYCDFNTYARKEHLIPDYIGALTKEIRLWGELLDAPKINTIFFGGGTPSYLETDALEHIVHTALSSFRVQDKAEITIEANPGDITEEKLRAWMRVGVNRISIGAQSLDDDLLGIMGRRHSAEQVSESLRMARKAGFSNVNLDLIYGVPHQSMNQWSTTLDSVVALGPDHLSLYCLTLEDGTPMKRLVEDKHLPEPNGDLAADMYTLASNMLANDGYSHYEISNWARQGYESRHNLVYWRNLPYLGVGPGAHSYVRGHRFSNLLSPEIYIRKVASCKAALLTGHSFGSFLQQRSLAVGWSEEIEKRMEMGETLMMGLRLADGIRYQEFRRRFGVDLGQVYRRQIDELTALGLLEEHESSVRLTPRGYLLGNEVFMRFLVDGLN